MREEEGTKARHTDCSVFQKSWGGLWLGEAKGLRLRGKQQALGRTDQLSFQCSLYHRPWEVEAGLTSAFMVPGNQEVYLEMEPIWRMVWVELGGSSVFPGMEVTSSSQVL